MGIAHTKRERERERESMEQESKNVKASVVKTTIFPNRAAARRFFLPVCIISRQKRGVTLPNNIHNYPYLPPPPLPIHMITSLLLALSLSPLTSVLSSYSRDEEEDEDWCMLFVMKHCVLLCQS